MRTAYPDEAQKLQAVSFECDVVTDEHREAAAALAERVQSHFPLGGPFDAGIPFWMAGIAQCGPFTIVTDDRRKALYAKVDGLVALTVEEYLALH